MSTFLLITVTLLIILAIYIGKQYNEAQEKAQTIEEAQANIAVTVKKRLDLVNKLVDIVSSYVNHEKLTHIAVVEGESVANLAQASIRADNTLTQLNSIARNYPDLKANGSYNLLMNNLTLIETEVQDRREGYNRVVRVYNTFCNAIPFLFFAPYLGFRKASFFNVATADSTDNIHNFSADDGTILREKFAGAGAQVLHGTKVLGNTLGTHGRTLLERSQAEIQKRRNHSSDVADDSAVDENNSPS